ncbi:MAG: hypothetical protein WC974_07065 [Thermoplasmata archaeon]
MRLQVTKGWAWKKQNTAVFTGHTHGTNEAYTLTINDNDVLSRSDPLSPPSFAYTDTAGTVYIETLTSTWRVVFD